jgi:hypothetical protein
MDWVKANLKEILMVIGTLGVPLGFVADTIYENGYNKGTIEGKQIIREQLRPQLDTANAKLNRVTGRAAEWKLRLDDC